MVELHDRGGVAEEVGEVTATPTERWAAILRASATGARSQNLMVPLRPDEAEELADVLDAAALEHDQLVRMGYGR
jgi:hypothetical protein